MRQSKQSTISQIRQKFTNYQQTSQELCPNLATKAQKIETTSTKLTKESEKENQERLPPLKAQSMK
jgi:hypothetical protein